MKSNNFFLLLYGLSLLIIFQSCKKQNVADSNYSFHKYIGTLKCNIQFDIVDDTINGVTIIDTIYNPEYIFLKRDYLENELIVLENTHNYLANSFLSSSKSNYAFAHSCPDDTTYVSTYELKCNKDSINIDIKPVVHLGNINFDVVNMLFESKFI